LGGATLAAVQGLLFLVLSPFIGIHFGVEQFGLMVLIVFLVAFALTALGFAVAWSLDSAQAFHAIINLFLIPLWLLSGALFPIATASGWIKAIMLANPLTYGVEALRSTLFAGAQTFSLGTALVVLVGFSLAVFVLSFSIVSRRRTLPA
jgi:ABC-2 type transport system permease protein